MIKKPFYVKLCDLCYNKSFYITTVFRVGLFQSDMVHEYKDYLICSDCYNEMVTNRKFISLAIISENFLSVRLK